MMKVTVVQILTIVKKLRQEFVFLASNHILLLQDVSTNTICQVIKGSRTEQRAGPS
jgi:hypothetical protein